MRREEEDLLVIVQHKNRPCMCMWCTIPHNVPCNYDATITKLCIRLALSTVHIKYVAKFHTKKTLAGVTLVVLLAWLTLILQE